MIVSRVGTDWALKSVACFFAFSYGEEAPSVVSYSEAWMSELFWKGTQSVAKTALEARSCSSFLPMFDFAPLTKMRFLRHAKAWKR